MNERPPHYNRRPTEDERTRARLGDRGVPGEPFPIPEGSVPGTQLKRRSHG